MNLVKSLSDFFKFSSELSDKYFSTLIETNDKNILCDQGLLIGDYKNIPLPLIFHHEEEKKFADIIETGTGTMRDIMHVGKHS